MKTKVIIKADDHLDKDFVKGEEGYIDGYIFLQHLMKACAVVVIKDRIVLVSPYNLQVIEPTL